MSQDIERVLQEKFGYSTFKPGQEEVLGHLLAGRSAVAAFPTGGGKSLCYQLPSLLLPGLTLVVSPLIALMKDQIDALTARGIPAARLDSSVSAEEWADVVTRLRNGDLRLLYVAPERFANERFRVAIDGLPIALFAVDEAHCISEWGHNFRPDYLKLAKFAQACKAERVLALTATATPRVLEDICRLFEIAPDCAVRTPFYRPNLTLLLTPTAAKRRDDLLLQRLRERLAGSTIIYVTYQHTAEVVAQRLERAGLPARAYHAGMKSPDRTLIQEWFMATDRSIVVATIAFGMGVDKANIRYVYHYNPPKSLESYAQEIGRAGRDGEPAICELLYCPDDLLALENFAYGDTPGPEAVRELLGRVFTDAEQLELSFDELARECDVRPLVVRTLLTYLELDGYLEAGTPFYEGYRFKPQMTSAEILAAFEGAQRNLVRGLLAQSQRARIRFHLDVAAAAARLGVPRVQAVLALDDLARRGMLELETDGVRHRYRRLATPEDLDALADELFQRAVDREEREIERLQCVDQLVGLNDCQVSALGAWFGEPLEKPCGHCSWCTSGTADVPKRSLTPLTAERLAQVLKTTPPLPARAAARFLCGLSSPGLVRQRLTKHVQFGALADVSFPEVLARLEART